MASSMDRRIPARGLALLAAAVAIMLSTAGASAAVPIVGSASSGGPPLVVIACAPGTPAPSVLLVRRVLLQTNGGQPTVPSWAGQWGVIAGTSVVSGSVQQRASGLLLAQTGQTFPSGSTFSLKVVSDPTDFSSTVYVIVQMSATALDALAAATNGAIAARTPSQGVLASAVTATFPEALQLLGPAPPPPGGWMEYVIQDAFGGVMPGPMDASLPILVSMLTTRAAMTTDAFQEALLLAGSCDG